MDAAKAFDDLGDLQFLEDLVGKRHCDLLLFADLAHTEASSIQ